MPSRYDCLPELVEESKAKVILEIGTWSGRNSIKMLEAAKKNHKPEDITYYGFDLFELMTEEIKKREVSKRGHKQGEVKQFLESTGCNIILNRGFSQQTVPMFIKKNPGIIPDFIYIDGGHHPDTVATDWKNVQPLIGEHTVVVFDDYVSDFETMKWGCNQVVDALDRTKFTVEITPVRDHFPGYEIDCVKVVKNGNDS